MRNLAFILFSASVCGLLWSCTAAAAENPWKLRYQTEKTADNQALPPELPAQSKAGKPAYRITYEELEQAIADALVQEGAGEHIHATMVDHKAGAFFSHHSPVEMEINNLAYNAEQSRWEATIYPDAQGMALAPIPISGHYEELAEVPVLKSRLRSDEIISADDIEMKKMGFNRLRKDTILAAEQLIGKTPYRTISPGRAIRKAEIVTPPSVHKNETVTMQYHMAGLEIRALGEALESGAEGDMIRVRNTDSNVVIHAKINGPGMVEAVPLGALVASR